jgi:hypothetical protein
VEGPFLVGPSARIPPPQREIGAAVWCFSSRSRLMWAPGVGGDRRKRWWRAAALTLFALLAARGGALATDTLLGALMGACGALTGIDFSPRSPSFCSSWGLKR